MFDVWFQVHITQGDHDGKGVIITWVTLYDRQPNLVTYWEANTTTKQMVQAKITNYKYYTYESGFIHHATIHGLKVSIWGFAVLLFFWLISLKF